MAKKAEKPAEKPPKKYKPFRFIRLPEPMGLELDKIAARRFTTVTEEVKQAVREYIERQTEKKS